MTSPFCDAMATSFGLNELAAITGCTRLAPPGMAGPVWMGGVGGVGAGRFGGPGWIGRGGAVVPGGLGLKIVGNRRPIAPGERTEPGSAGLPPINGHS